MAVQIADSPSTQRQMLDSTKTVVIGGAGPYGLTAALALSRKLGKNVPHISIVEPCDLLSCDKWEPCKGCAGGILRGTIDHIVSEYDLHHIVNFEPDCGISIQTPQGRRCLSRCRVDEIAFHLPHELKIDPPIIRFQGLELVVPTFRIEGPRYLHDDWVSAGHIGFSPFMFELLRKLNPDVEQIPGRIRALDTDGDRPQVDIRWHDQDTTIEADHVLITTGIAKSRPPLIKQGGTTQELPRVRTLRTLLMSTVVPENEVTKRVFNIRRGQMTLFRAHLFVGQGPVHYILTMPKVVGNRVALSVATFGQEAGEDLTADAVTDFLANHPAFKDTGIDFAAEDSYCHCGAFIPNGTLTADEQHGKGYSLGGDIAGGLRLWKNGIGTAINEAERLVDYMAESGYSKEALDLYFEESTRRVTQDNMVGRQLLGWVDTMLAKATMPQLLQIYLGLEQRLKPQQQWLLPIFGATTTGKMPYRELRTMLRHGLRGTLLEGLAFVFNAPLP